MQWKCERWCGNLEAPAQPLRAAGVKSHRARVYVQGGHERYKLDLYLPKKGVAEAETRVSESTAETRVATSELVDSQQFFTHGRVSDVFSLVNKIADRVDPLPVRHAFPATQSPAAIRAAQPEPHPPQRSFWAGDYTNPASPAYDPWQANQMAQYDLKNVPKALVYRELGSIQYIDKTWKFTVVRPVKGVQLRTNDPLHVLYDEGDVYANLRVGTVEKAGAIADYGSATPEHHPLFNGDKVFGWHTPPPEKTPNTK